MAGKDFLFTSESVSEGHPDKLCDQVSDAILDAHLAGDPNSRVACESLAKTGMVVVAGEITSSVKVSYVDIVREVVREIGYTDSAMGFAGHPFVISTQHSPEVEYSKLRETIIEGVIKAVIPPEYLDKDTVYHVNPTGRFVVGGPQGDCGLTGRKIIVDTYGGMGRHGGGAFSGKDPSKVDRSAAYAARWVAKNLVAAGAATRAEVQVAYAIGVAHPVSIMVETFGTEQADPA